MKKINWQSVDTYYELEARNVGDENPESTIQLFMTETPKDPQKRQKMFGINIPKEKVKDFLDIIIKEG